MHSTTTFSILLPPTITFSVLQILQSLDSDPSKQVFSCLSKRTPQEADSSCELIDDSPPGSPPILARSSSWAGAPTTAYQTASTAERALLLPQVLLPRWITAAGPTLDLREATLSHVELSKLLMALRHVAPGDITTLHLPAPRALSGPDVACLAHIKLAAANGQEGFECCYSWCAGYFEQPSRVTLAFRCSCGGMLLSLIHI